MMIGGMIILCHNAMNAWDDQVIGAITGIWGTCTVFRGAVKFHRFLWPQSLHFKQTKCIKLRVYVAHTSSQYMMSVMWWICSQLIANNLPAAIEDLSGRSVPPSILSKAATVRQFGGIEYISRLNTELPQLLQRNRELLDEASLTSVVMVNPKQPHCGLHPTMFFSSDSLF